VAYSDYDTSLTTSTNDRRWKYRFCRPSDGSFGLSDEYDLSTTDDYASATRQCSGNYQGMYAVESSFSTAYHDRAWTWSCATFNSTKYNLTNCAWSDYVNDGYDDFTYECPNNGILYGVESQMSGHLSKDRKWNFYCCRMQGGSTSDPTSGTTADPTYDPTADPTSPWLCKEEFQNNANNDDEEYAGQATSMEECIQLVRANCDWANIANVHEAVGDNEAADCWCQTGNNMTYNNTSEFISCWFGESTSDTVVQSAGTGKGESVRYVVMAAVILVLCFSVSF